tara:strand:- start:2 stop:748 length:747 start_codon:yes stop_codon:yes gene_type:complete
MFYKFIYVVLFIVCVNTVGFSQPDSAWQSIFNGQDLDGWSIIDPPVNVAVKDSSIVIHMKPHTSRHAFIRTNKKYKDFIFEMDYRRDFDMDSGVMFRCIEAPQTAFSALFGYMVKLDPKPNRFWSGGLFVDFGNGYSWLQTLEDNEKARHAEKKDGEWNHLSIEVIGDIIKVWINNIPTVHIKDDRYKEGYIAMKIHYLNSGSEEKQQLELAYKNARIITENINKYSKRSDLLLKDTRGELDITYFRK